MSDVRITIIENGPLKVEGPAELFDHEGNRVETRPDRPFFLCRCGASERKPFCDGKHKAIGFDGCLAAAEG